MRRCFRAFYGSALLLLASAPQSARAQSGEQGNVCVQDYRPGAACLANDVRIVALKAIQILDPCIGSTDTATLKIDATLSTAGGPDRSDVGFWVALDGGNANTGDVCYHDFLSPPLTTSPVYSDSNGNGVPDLYNGPWANLEPGDPTDSCGDVQKQTSALVLSEVVKTLDEIEIACIDRDANRVVDVSVCTSWDNTSSNTCVGLTSAYPLTTTKCGCQILDVTGLPEPGAALSLACGAALLAALARSRE